MDIKEINDKWESFGTKYKQLQSELQAIKSKLTELDQEKKEFYQKAEASGFVYDFDSWVKKGDERKNPLLEILGSPNYEEIFADYISLLNEIFDGSNSIEKFDYIVRNQDHNEIVVQHIRELVLATMENDTRKLNRLFYELEKFAPDYKRSATRFRRW